MDIIGEITSALNLVPLPIEGGVHSVTYRSADVHPPETLPPRYSRGSRPFCGAIYYLLSHSPDSFSAMHRLPTDEIYHFYLGDPVQMLLLYPDGSSRRMILGADILHDQYVQFIVHRDVWQGSFLLPGGRFALMGTTMAPAYEESDYLAGDRDDLLRRYPQETDLINKLTRIS